MARHLSPPQAIGGYSDVRPLGTGGFADVFLYEQDMPCRVAAVKVLLAPAVNPEVRRTLGPGLRCSPPVSEMRSHHEPSF